MNTQYTIAERLNIIRFQRSTDKRQKRDVLVSKKRKRNSKIKKKNT